MPQSPADIYRYLGCLRSNTCMDDRGRIDDDCARAHCHRRYFGYSFDLGDRFRFGGMAGPLAGLLSELHGVGAAFDHVHGRDYADGLGLTHIMHDMVPINSRGGGGRPGEGVMVDHVAGVGSVVPLPDWYYEHAGAPCARHPLSDYPLARPNWPPEGPVPYVFPVDSEVMVEGQGCAGYNAFIDMGRDRPMSRYPAYNWGQPGAMPKLSDFGWRRFGGQMGAARDTWTNPRNLELCACSPRPCGNFGQGWQPGAPLHERNQLLNDATPWICPVGKAYVHFESSWARVEDLWPEGDIDEGRLAHRWQRLANETREAGPCLPGYKSGRLYLGGADGRVISTCLCTWPTDEDYAAMGCGPNGSYPPADVDPENYGRFIDALINLSENQRTDLVNDMDNMFDMARLMGYGWTEEGGSIPGRDAQGEGTVRNCLRWRIDGVTGRITGCAEWGDEVDPMSGRAEGGSGDGNRGLPDFEVDSERARAVREAVGIVTGDENPAVENPNEDVRLPGGNAGMGFDPSIGDGEEEDAEDQAAEEGEGGEDPVMPDNVPMPGDLPGGGPGGGGIPGGGNAPDPSMAPAGGAEGARLPDAQPGWNQPDVFEDPRGDAQRLPPGIGDGTGDPIRAVDPRTGEGVDGPRGIADPCAPQPQRGNVDPPHQPDGQNPGGEFAPIQDPDPGEPPDLREFIITEDRYPDIDYSTMAGKWIMEPSLLLGGWQAADGAPLIVAGKGPKYVPVTDITQDARSPIAHPANIPPKVVSGYNRHGITDSFRYAFGLYYINLAHGEGPWGPGTMEGGGGNAGSGMRAGGDDPVPIDGSLFGHNGEARENRASRTERIAAFVKTRQGSGRWWSPNRLVDAQGAMEYAKLFSYHNNLNPIPGLEIDPSFENQWGENLLYLHHSAKITAQIYPFSEQFEQNPRLIRDGVLPTQDWLYNNEVAGLFRANSDHIELGLPIRYDVMWINFVPKSPGENSNWSFWEYFWGTPSYMMFQRKIRPLPDLDQHERRRVSHIRRRQAAWMNTTPDDYCSAEFIEQRLVDCSSMEALAQGFDHRSSGWEYFHAYAHQWTPDYEDTAHNEGEWRKYLTWSSWERADHSTNLHAPIPIYGWADQQNPSAEQRDRDFTREGGPPNMDRKRLRLPQRGTQIFTDHCTFISSFMTPREYCRSDHGTEMYFHAEGSYNFYDCIYENKALPETEHRRLPNFYHYAPGSSIFEEFEDRARAEFDQMVRLARHRRNPDGTPIDIGTVEGYLEGLYDRFGLNGNNISERFLQEAYGIIPPPLQPSPVLIHPDPSKEEFKQVFKERHRSAMHVELEFTSLDKSAIAQSLRMDKNFSYMNKLLEPFAKNELRNMEVFEEMLEGSAEERASLRDDMVWNRVDPLPVNNHHGAWVQVNIRRHSGTDNETVLTRVRPGEIGTISHDLLNPAIDEEGNVASGVGNIMGHASTAREMQLGDWFAWLDTQVNDIVADAFNDVLGPGSSRRMNPRLWAAIRFRMVFNKYVLRARLKKIIKRNYRTIEEMFRGKPAHSEIVGYKVEKLVFSENNSQKVQSFYFGTNDDVEIVRFLDTQVKYGTTYEYRVYTLFAVIGTKYAYLDNQSEQETTNGLNMNGGQVDEFKDKMDAWKDGSNTAKPTNAKMSCGIIHTPSVKIIEIFCRTRRRVAILDRPPVPPKVDIIPFKGVGNRILINIESQTGEFVAPRIVLHSDDIGEINEAVANQGQQPRNEWDAMRESIGAILESRKITSIEDAGRADVAAAEGSGRTAWIHFKNDDPCKTFEVYRIDFYPDSWSDFMNKRIKVIHSDATSASLIDFIEPNVKYYYTFRAVDVHGNVSNPSHIYQVELVQDLESVYILTDVVYFKQIKRPVRREFRQIMKIEPSFLQQYVPLPEAGTLAAWEANFPERIGISRVPIWDKTFKVRITSKKTGKQIDVNFKFKKDYKKVEPDAPTDECGIVEGNASIRHRFASRFSRGAEEPESVVHQGNAGHAADATADPTAEAGIGVINSLNDAAGSSAASDPSRWDDLANRASAPTLARGASQPALNSAAVRANVSAEVRRRRMTSINSMTQPSAANRPGLWDSVTSAARVTDTSGVGTGTVRLTTASGRTMDIHLGT